MQYLNTSCASVETECLHVVELLCFACMKLPSSVMPKKIPILINPEAVYRPPNATTVFFNCLGV